MSSQEVVHADAQRVCVPSFLARHPLFFLLHQRSLNVAFFFSYVLQEAPEVAEPTDPAVRLGLVCGSTRADTLRDDSVVATVGLDLSLLVDADTSAAGTATALEGEVPTSVSIVFPCCICTGAPNDTVFQSVTKIDVDADRGDFFASHKNAFLNRLRKDRVYSLVFPQAHL